MEEVFITIALIIKLVVIQPVVFCAITCFREYNKFQYIIFGFVLLFM